MRNEVRHKIELIVDTLMSQLQQDTKRLTICTACSAQFINYYIEKGFIFESEKRECCKFVCSYINSKYFKEIPIPEWILNGLVEMMMAEKKFNYEDLIFPIQTLMSKR